MPLRGGSSSQRQGTPAQDVSGGTGVSNVTTASGVTPSVVYPVDLTTR